MKYRKHYESLLQRAEERLSGGTYDVAVELCECRTQSGLGRAKLQTDRKNIETIVGFVPKLNRCSLTDAKS